MSTIRQRTACRCVSDKEIVTLYPDSHGKCAIIVESNLGDLEVLVPIHSAKIRCTRCRRLTLELITVFPKP